MSRTRSLCVSVGLGAGLAVGAVAEAAKRGFGLADISDTSRLSQLAKF